MDIFLVFENLPVKELTVNNYPCDSTLIAQSRSGDKEKDSANQGSHCITIAVVQFPGSSNLDEFLALDNLAGVRLVWAHSQEALAGLSAADYIILPGSCAISSDLAWLRTSGLDRLVNAHAAQGGAVLGISGGAQMLAEALIDPHSIEGNAAGLGLLSVVTCIEQNQSAEAGPVQFHRISGRWAALSNLTVLGREICHRHTSLRADMAAAGDGAVPVIPQGLAWQNTQGNVLGVYLHGLFENRGVLKALALAQ